VSRCAVSLAAALLAAAAPRAHAQSAFGVQVGHLFEGDGWTTYHVGMERELLGPLGGELYGTHLRAAAPGTERLWGVGADMTLFRVGRRGVYTVAGVAGGFASGATKDLWASWSAGAGMQLLPFGPVAIAAEGRWRHLTPGSRDGLELSARLSIGFGGGGGAPTSPPRGETRPSAPAGAPAANEPGGVPLSAISAPATLGDSVVATAAGMMGTAYRLGGTGAEGFDCSGLIQYAYDRHGIRLPRTSSEQALQGRAVARELEALRPGDILTFSNSGGPVTHVGLYVGEGRFIHSASRGVQLSLLSERDPYRSWWWRRWVGARRIVGD
jgi:cell wall-associated NlpC family hydrolase